MPNKEESNSILQSYSSALNLDHNGVFGERLYQAYKKNYEQLTVIAERQGFQINWSFDT
jgi:hypothetical protein